jgi:hypothetical protein
MMTTATGRKRLFEPFARILERPAHGSAKTRQIGGAALAGIASAIAVMVIVSLNPGYWFPPKLTMPAGGPPWDVPWVHIPVRVATIALWLAAMAGGGGVAAGLVAVRRGWRPDPRLLVTGGLLTVAILAVLPPAGSTDALDYATFGHIVTLGHTPYVWAPYHLRVDRSAFGTEVPVEWARHVTLYGPLATFEQYLAATLGGSSVAVIVFWLKLWNAIAFATVSLVADRLLRSNPAARLRAHLLWTANPLLLWGLIAAGHIDMLAAGAGLIGLLIIGTSRDTADLSTTRAVIAGLFLGAAADIKIPYLIFSIAAAWALRHAVRPLLVTTAAALVVLVPTYLWFGPPAVRAVLDRTTKVSADNFYQLFASPAGFVFRNLLEVSVGLVLLLALVLCWRLPHVMSPTPALRPALALSCAWLFVWPYQLPWYDAMIICLLLFYPASRLDWIVLGRLTVGTIALIPGDPFLHAGRLIDGLNQDIVTLWAPLLLLACVVGLAFLSLTGRWRLSQDDIPMSSVSKPIPVRT